MIATDKDGIKVDTLAIIYGESWLSVLAVPDTYRLLQRAADPAVLLQLLDIWIAYAERGDHYLCTTPPDEQRPALARKLRALIEAWTPPELPAEITDAAGDLLRAEGLETSAFGFHFSSGRPLESYLIWSEGFPAILPNAVEATDAERATRAETRSQAIRKWLAELTGATQAEPPPSGGTRGPHES